MTDRSLHQAGRTGIRLTLAFLGGVAALIITAQAAPTAQAAAIDEISDPAFLNDLRILPGDAKVLRAQQALNEIGLYLGPLDGQMGPETARAIRDFQKRNGMKPDGKVDDALLEKLESGTRVGALMNRLQKSRERMQDEARKALMQNAATRKLLDKDVIDPKALALPVDYTERCFRAPTPECLLTEAAVSAVQVEKEELRDWALSELLVSQIEAGMNEPATATVRRMRDPSLIMVALRNIAITHANAGRSDEAMKTVKIIPDAAKRAEALAAVAESQIAEGRVTEAIPSIAQLKAEILSVDNTTKRVTLLAQAAVLLSRAGEDAAALTALEETEREARSGDQGGRSLRYLAGAFADMDKPSRALNLIDEMPGASDRTPVLVAAARVQAKQGDFVGALDTAARIEEVRYTVVVLSEIALEQAKVHDFISADETLEEARTLTARIRFPFARDFARSRMALTLGQMPGSTEKRRDYFADAIETAGPIKDDRLRSQVLWAIAAEQDRAGHPSDATRAKAEASTTEIKSALTRVWMFADIARGHRAKGEDEVAWDAFERAVDIASSIEDSWSRARSLAKLGSTMNELTRLSPRTLVNGDIEG